MAAAVPLTMQERIERYLFAGGNQRHHRRLLPTPRQWRRAVHKARRHGEEISWTIPDDGEHSPADEYLASDWKGSLC